ncbi:acyl-CoA N-acyltransferase [Aureobasidium pullulans]|uniref:Acyl-CoA N-acyltransferase n=1 Tax=Aureobasidium pullulans TaxID=5580 RepID=A0A4T0DMK4_AURPU|nr:acyl-CoA N-acyltransferase [Aureobasidium pullulans]
MTTAIDGSKEVSLPDLHYIQYDPDKEAQYLSAIRELISKDLSEPYSIYVYRYFLYQWADLCYMTVDASGELIGVVVCKLEPHRGGPMRGYIAMLAVKKEHRGRGIASKLVRMAMDGMIAKDAEQSQKTLA